ncbi:sugar ABC transporter ATP-binding protein [Homoserinibacter sp. GY 40078]|uniref:sugar ABC transporter ATP-binding protein n=1 Tax=Homoserinibacter sp. GY 40078 TaxID=2603275 RepID=UPI0011CCACFA|nr:sugar ABC transporter ATP-binding protein [Homoserinibacter sp. GY 40078]TXK19100.1 sugar ABC transporter ATP-binding protein [Homoserinibacter sp. GY 40078]
MNSTALVDVRGVSKSFGGASALDDVSIAIGPNEVHGLLGENGSGKSTLIKVLSGFHEPDAGALVVRGQDVPLPLRPGGFRELGFEFVHQDLGLIPSLSVAENLFLNETAGSRSLFVSPRAAQRRASAILESHGVILDPSAPIDSVRPVDRAMLAIVRAIENLRRDGGSEATLLVLDEPTVFLPQNEVEILFGFVRSIVADGASVLFVSHDLDEVLDITDRVTVLRDGRVAGSVTTSDVDKAELVRMIIGHELTPHLQVEEAAPLSDDEIALRVTGLSTTALADVSFDLREGEVLGFAGLVGSGYDDVVYALFGASPAEGRIEIPGHAPIDLARHTTHAAVRDGFALVPADRKNHGSIPTLSAADNINMTVLDSHFRGGILRRGELRRNAHGLMTSYDVRPMRPDLDYGSFSGGNQQKAMMAKWQQTAPRLLLVHEPTQGVDIGARDQIHRLIRSNAATTAAICASSDYEQLAELCDRVGIIVRGRLTGFLSGSALTKAAIADRCHGRTDASPTSRT